MIQALIDRTTPAPMARRSPPPPRDRSEPPPASGPMPRPVRVALVGPSLDILGGQAVQVQRLLTRLGSVPSLSVEFLPVNPRLPGPLRMLQRVKYLRTVATSVAYAASLLRRVGRYDVVHAFSASYWSFLLAPVPAMLVARMLGRRVVLNYRSGEADDHLGRSAVARKLVRLADAVVVPSGYLVGVFGKHGLAARSIVNFVEIERIYPMRERRGPRPVFLAEPRSEGDLCNVGCVLAAFHLSAGAPA